MNIAERIAAKRRELAQFVTESAEAVIAEDMSDALRGAAALDLLRLMVASGLSAQAGPTIDVTPKIAVAAAAVPKRSPLEAFSRSEKAETSQVEIASVENEAVEIPTASLSIVASPPKVRAARQRKFTDEQLLAAVAEHGNDTNAIADKLNITPAYVNMHRRRLGCPSPKGQNGGRPAKVAIDWPLTPVEWTEANRARLIDLTTASPRPSTEDVARAFSTTPSAIQTAMSRFGITKGYTGTKAGELKDLSGFKRRDCMTCDRPFLSEGSHNRMCTKCKSDDEQVAA